MTFIEAVEAARVAKGWMKKTLCERAGVRTSTYAAWEKGKNPPPLDAVERLARVAGVWLSPSGEWGVRHDPSFGAATGGIVNCELRHDGARHTNDGARECDVNQHELRHSEGAYDMVGG